MSDTGLQTGATPPALPLPALPLPAIAWASQGEPVPDALGAMPCPNCGSSAPQALSLTVDVRLPGSPARHLHLLHCTGCDARFYDQQVPPNYAELGLQQRGSVPYYVQQGAGVSLITRPLAQLGAPPGSSYMEVGCGFGFGLDFAIHTRGWTGLGIDPAPLAGLGRDIMGLPIELRYLRDDDEAQGTMDVVLGSEVVEHVTSPAAFIRTLRAMLRPGGTLVLTTPNGDDLHPGTPPGSLFPMLSPGLHLVIQTSRSLGRLLRDAGFTHVEIGADSHALVAFASDAPLLMEREPSVLRKSLRQHLLQRARVFDRSGDVFLGMAGRAFQECVNDSDVAGADEAWAMLVPACQDRFGLDLHNPALPGELNASTLERMAELVPLNLGGLLCAYGVRQVISGVPRAGLAPLFTAAAAAAAALRRALGELGLEDAHTEDIGWTATAEALMCEAEAAVPGVQDRLAVLPPAPVGGTARRASIARQVFSRLVQTGQYEPARALALAEFTSPSPEPLSPESRDLEFGLAVLDMHLDPPQHARAARRFASVRSVTAPQDGLWQAAARGGLQAAQALGPDDAVALIQELAGKPGVVLDHADFNFLVNAGRYDMARNVMLRYALDAAPFANPDSKDPLTPGNRDNLFFLAVLDLHTDPPHYAQAKRRFARVRAHAAPHDGLWQAAAQGELQAARALGQDDAIELIDEMLGQPGSVLGHADFNFLVNAGRYDMARSVMVRHGLDAAPFTDSGNMDPLTPEDRNTLFFMGVLDAQIGQDGGPTGDPALARLRFMRVRAATIPGDGLWWAALGGELQCCDLLGDREAAVALVREVQDVHPTLPVPDSLQERFALAKA